MVFTIRAVRPLLKWPLLLILVCLAACAFGQEDDITVLSIRWLAAAEEPAKARVNLTAQIATV